MQSLHFSNLTNVFTNLYKTFIVILHTASLKITYKIDFVSLFPVSNISIYSIQNAHAKLNIKNIILLKFPVEQLNVVLQ